MAQPVNEEVPSSGSSRMVSLTGTAVITGQGKQQAKGKDSKSRSAGFVRDRAGYYCLLGAKAAAELLPYSSTSSGVGSGGQAFWLVLACFVACVRLSVS